MRARYGVSFVSITSDSCSAPTIVIPYFTEICRWGSSWQCSQRLYRWLHWLTNWSSDLSLSICMAFLYWIENISVNHDDYEDMPFPKFYSYYITVVSHEHHFISKSPAFRLFLQPLGEAANKVNIQVLHYWHFMWGIHKSPVAAPQKRTVVWEVFPCYNVLISDWNGFWMIAQNQSVAGILNPGLIAKLRDFLKTPLDIT